MTTIAKWIGSMPAACATARAQRVVDAVPRQQDEQRQHAGRERDAQPARAARRPW
jgi:hypothetical protein